MKYILALTIFNLFAAAVCLVGFVFDVYVGWGFAALQLGLFSVNCYMGYVNYQRYKEMQKVYKNDGN